MSTFTERQPVSSKTMKKNTLIMQDGQQKQLVEAIEKGVSRDAQANRQR